MYEVIYVMCYHIKSGNDTFAYFWFAVWGLEASAEICGMTSPVGI